MRQKLTELCDILYGFAFDSAGFTEDSTYPPLVRIRDVKRGYSETNYSGDYQEQYVIHAGDLLIGMDGEFNIARWKSRDALLNQRVCKISAKEGTEEEYLRFALSRALREIENRTAFVTVKHLSAKELNKLELQVPSLSEQNRIAITLRRIEQLIDLRNEELKKLDELIRARFVELFGDPISNSKNLETKSLNEIMILKAGDFTAASAISDTLTETHRYPCYGGNGIRGFVAEYNQEGEYSLIGRQGALSGNVQYAKGRFKNTEHALLVTPKIQMNSIWLNQLLINLELKRFQTGAAQPGLSVKNLQDIPIITVSIEKQNRFADFVAKIDKSKAVMQKSLEEAQLLFDSLMQQYFG